MESTVAGFRPPPRRTYQLPLAPLPEELPPEPDGPDDVEELEELHELVESDVSSIRGIVR